MLAKSLMTVALLAATTIAAQAQGAGDPVKGKAVYKRCVVCHTDTKGGSDTLGPNLFGIVGKKAASKPGYAYSAPLQAASTRSVGALDNMNGGTDNINER